MLFSIQVDSFGLLMTIFLCSEYNSDSVPHPQLSFKYNPQSRSYLPDPTLKKIGLFLRMEKFPIVIVEARYELQIRTKDTSKDTSDPNTVAEAESIVLQ